MFSSLETLIFQNYNMNLDDCFEYLKPRVESGGLHYEMCREMCFSIELFRQKRRQISFSFLMCILLHGVNRRDWLYLLRFCHYTEKNKLKFDVIIEIEQTMCTIHLILLVMEIIIRLKLKSQVFILKF